MRVPNRPKRVIQALRGSFINFSKASPSERAAFFTDMAVESLSEAARRRQLARLRVSAKARKRVPAHA
jgi:hypothetical protein